MVLAGGLGTRLRPLTYTRPKPLLPIANRPHLEHVLELLASYDVGEVVFLTSYMAEAFDPLIRSARDHGIKMQVATEDEPLGTAGAIKNGAELAGDETFYVLNGDILTDADLGKLEALHRSSGAEATIMLTPVDDPSSFGVVPTEADGKVIEFVEKPPPSEAVTNLINAGVYVLEPSVLDRIPPDRVYSAERELFPAMAAEGRLFAHPPGGYWIDIGTPDKYLQANIDAVTGRYHDRAGGASDENEVLSASGARVARNARVSCSVLGADSSVGAAATVDRSVLLPGAIVEEGATVTGSILGERAVVAAGVTISAGVLADGENLGDDGGGQ